MKLTLDKQMLLQTLAVPILVNAAPFQDSMQLVITSGHGSLYECDCISPNGSDMKLLLESMDSKYPCNPLLDPLCEAMLNKCWCHSQQKKYVNLIRRNDGPACLSVSDDASSPGSVKEEPRSV